MKNKPGFILGEALISLIIMISGCTVFVSSIQMMNNQIKIEENKVNARFALLKLIESKTDEITVNSDLYSLKKTKKGYNILNINENTILHAQKK